MYRRRSGKLRVTNSLISYGSAIRASQDWRSRYACGQYAQDKRMHSHTRSHDAGMRFQGHDESKSVQDTASLVHLKL